MSLFQANVNLKTSIADQISKTLLIVKTNEPKRKEKQTNKQTNHRTNTM